MKGSLRRTSKYWGRMDLNFFHLIRLQLSHVEPCQASLQSVASIRSPSTLYTELCGTLWENSTKLHKLDNCGNLFGPGGWMPMSHVLERVALLKPLTDNFHAQTEFQDDHLHLCNKVRHHWYSGTCQQHEGSSSKTETFRMVFSCESNPWMEICD